LVGNASKMLKGLGTWKSSLLGLSVDAVFGTHSNQHPHKSPAF